MKVWITKYALTIGVVEKEGKLSDSNYFYEKREPSSGCPPHYWHTTKQDAIAQAERMRIKKIASLEKQIEKIKKLEFK